jgi:hypothetical protein
MSNLIIVYGGRSFHFILILMTMFLLELQQWLDENLSQIFLNGIFCHKFVFEKNCLKGARNVFWGRASSHLSLLATILKIPWNNVTSQVEIYLGMFATLAPSRNWKKHYYY